MFYLADFVHRDLATWREHLPAHMDWLHRMAEGGTVAASGPVTEPAVDGELAAMILLRADDLAGARAVIATDPFAVHGVTEDLTVRGWNPFIGAFAAQTTPPPQLAQALRPVGDGAGASDDAGPR